MMIRPRKSTALSSNQAVSASDEVAFECTLIPVTAVRQRFTGAREKPVSSKSTTGFFEALAAGAS